MFIPIWGLASLEIVRRYEDIKEDRAAVLAQALLSLLLLVFGTYNVVSLVNRTGLSELEGRIRWISMAGSLLTVILIFMLVAWGWSVRAGRAGLLLGLSTMLGVIMLSAAWSSSGLGRNPAAEAWLPSPFFKDADLLDNTLTQVSQRTAGDRTGVDLQVFAPGSDSIRWALRRHRNITYPNQLKADTRPSVMITSHEDITGAADNYTGQDMILEQWPAWRELTARDWMIWLLYRQAPMEDKHLFLWLRTDLVPGQEAVTIEGQP
jgi:hypothetical protein